MGERQPACREQKGKMNPPQQLAWKARGPKVHEFLQPARLKARNFKGQCAWVWENIEDTGAAHGEKAGQTAHRHTHSLETEI